jgi:NADH-quinone oxidoreductase subunit H
MEGLYLHGAGHAEFLPLASFLGLPPLREWNPVWLAIIRCLIWVVPVMLLLVPAIWFERRLLGWMQDRQGPNRVGPFGLLQPVADISKLFFKEEIIPSGVDRGIYILAPILSLIPPVLLGATIPIWPLVGDFKYLTPIANLDIGVLFLFAVSSLGVYGLVLGGYSGNNKYSMLGGLRASAQLISYELAMGMSLACIVLLDGSLKIPDMVANQQTPLWAIPGCWVADWNIFTPFGFFAGIVFFVCMFAETNRAPFDLPEGENEIIGGYHTEYSSTKFVAFLMAEYMAMVVYGAVFASVFLGGYSLLPINWETLATEVPAAAGFAHFMGWLSDTFGPIWLVGKICLGIFAYIWVRGTLPRLRYDQLMNLGWRILLPMATINLVIVGLWQVTAGTFGLAIGWGVTIAAYLLVFMIYGLVGRQSRATSAPLDSRSIDLVEVPATKKPEASQPEAAGGTS